MLWPREGDPEFGVSRGRLLPKHTVFNEVEITDETRQKIAKLASAGSRRYGSKRRSDFGNGHREVFFSALPPNGKLVRKRSQSSMRSLTRLRQAILKLSVPRRIENFFGPLQKIIPWCTNLFTNSLVEQCQEKYGDQFWGFWMLGGMAGGGHGIHLRPKRKTGSSTVAAASDVGHEAEDAAAAAIRYGSGCLRI